jgi:hypothetical protein
MFDDLDPSRVRTEAMRANRAALERYLASVASLVRASGDATPCAVFELSTSADPLFAQKVLDGTASAPDARTPASHRGRLAFIVRESLKFVVLWALGWRWRFGHRDAFRALARAEALLVGYVAVRDGRAVAQDFRGFVDTELRDRRIATIGRRLPQTPVRAYFAACGTDVIPVEACLRWRDLLRGLRAGLRLLRAAADLPPSSPVRAVVAQDVGGGHMMSGWLGAHGTAARIVQHLPHSAPVCLPMERHDWELLLTRAVRARGYSVWAVQNCSFSPFDLNMYAALRGAPDYRNAQPDRLFLLAPVWENVFRELGLACAMSVLSSHRFSGVSFPLRLASGHGLLYLGSINAEKVRRDLRTLAALPEPSRVQLRLHPSLANLPEAAAFGRQKDFDTPYGLCVYADTTMVFQLDADRSRLCFLDHEGFPNQDPAAFFGDWPGSTLQCRGHADDAATLWSKLS